MAEPDDGGLDGFYSIDQLLHEEGLLQDAPSFEDIVDEHPAANLQNNRNKKDLSLEAKRRIVNHILESMKDGKIPRGTLVNLARQFGVHKSTIGRIYKDVQQQKRNGMCIDVRSKKIGKNGRKPKDYPEAWLQSVPLHLRTTERSFGGFLKISHVAVHRLKKRGKLRSHTASTHPLLTDTHKIKRMQWVLSHILHASVNRKLTFKPMRHVIHTDEKWFYMNPDTRRFYLLPREDDPHCCTVSKKFRVKAMFMGVISRPIYDQAGNLVFDGKFGIFPFTFKQKAVRSSKNRQAGTWETKPIQNITKGVIRDMLVNNVIPAIKSKWPMHLSKDLVIQWDNARPHVIPTDDEFVEACHSDGFNIQVVFQPPQSPDLNVLDLGLFRTIQSLQYQSFPKTIDDLVKKVEESYEAFDVQTNKFSWLTLQYVMLEILKVKGGNNYKIPHIGKQRLERAGMLPTEIEIPRELVNEVVAYISERIIGGVENMDWLFEEGGVDAD